MRNLLVILMASVVLSSCGPDVAISDYIEPLDSVWTSGEVVSIDYETQDTNRLFDLVASIDHSEDYDFQNLYVRISNVFPDGEKMDRQVSLNLADKSGKWQGKCKSGICTAKIKLQEGFFFPQQGRYSIIMEPYMRTDSITGIGRISLSLVNSLKKRK